MEKIAMVFNGVFHVGDLKKAERNIFVAGLVALFACVAAAPAIAQDRLAFDQPTEVGGIEVVCTGIGSTARADPRWQSYPVKVEVAGAGGQFLGDVAVSFERDGLILVQVSCGGPWVLARLSPGAYTISATFEGLSTSSRVNLPSEGQEVIILRFPQTGGAVSPEHAISPN